MKSVRARILLLLTLFTLCFLCGISYWNGIEEKQVNVLSNQAADDQSEYLHRIIDLKGQSLKEMTLDYTTWDEFVTFTLHPNETWGRNSLDAALGTYDCTAFWVFNIDNKTIYSISPNYPKLIEFPNKNPYIFNLMKSDYIHFFQVTNVGLVEFSGAYIRKGYDKKRTGTKYGYFLVARCWDNNLLDTISKLTGANVSITSASYSRKDIRCIAKDDGSIVYTQIIRDHNGLPIKQLKLETSSTVVRSLQKQNDKTLLLYTLFSVFLLVMLFITLFIWVSQPISIIVRSIKNKTPADLHNMENDTTEFGNLAQVVHNFFDQQNTLIDEISERKRVETELHEEINRHKLTERELQKVRDFLEKRVVERTWDLINAYDRTIEGWSRALDLRDKETEGHCQRVTMLTILLAKEIGLHEQEIIDIKRGALLHDIGKMGIPDSVLLKPGPLTEDEWKIMKMHTVYAYEMLYPIEFLRPAIDIPWCHHEKWDGTGYPRGLKGEEIPIAARLFSVVDVWDALQSDRPYRKAWPNQKIFEYIKSLSGIQFDPQIVDLFVNTMKGIAFEDKDIAA